MSLWVADCTRVGLEHSTKSMWIGYSRCSSSTASADESTTETELGTHPASYARRKELGFNSLDASAGKNSCLHRGYECKKHLLWSQLHGLQGDVDVAVLGRILLDEVPLGHVFRMWHRK